MAVAIIALERQWQEQSFWLATIAFTLATLGIITAGRSGFGLAQALASRYATVSIPLVVAVYVIFASQSAKRPNPVGIALMSVVLVMMVVGAGVSFAEGRKGDSDDEIGTHPRTFRCSMTRSRWLW